MTDKELEQRAAGIAMIVFDVDGVMTDGRTYIGSDGVETKAFDIRDGFSIVMARRAGLKFGLITGLMSPLVEIRAGRLGIEEVHQGFVDKDVVLQGIVARNNLTAEQVAYMGDDLFDIPAMRLAGLSAAPVDAAPEVREAADWIATQRGGRGAVREFIELVMKAKRVWEEAYKFYTKT
jgi:3-deoxy-D-manno-octulosonate 8-phosphate phosphatase (KDO 8-P phosphatase)